jgi:diguanylate cyclase (GGDEF)-like protein
MPCSKTWTAVLAAVGVVCSAVLITLAGEVLLGTLLGVVTMGCLSYLYVAAWRAEARCAAGKTQEPSGEESIIGAMDQAVDGAKPDLSRLSPSAGAAVTRVADRLDAFTREIAELSPSDELTSLAKEEVFNNVLWREFNRALRYKGDLSLVLIEIEGLDEFRAARGQHAAGELARHVASVVLQTVRESDLAARYGETFAVIMPETGQQGAADFSQRVRGAASEGDFKVNGDPVTVTLAIGAASVPNAEIKTAPNLVEKAAAALGANRSNRGSAPA